MAVETLLDSGAAPVFSRWAFGEAFAREPCNIWLAVTMALEAVSSCLRSRHGDGVVAIFDDGCDLCVAGLAGDAGVTIFDELLESVSVALSARFGSVAWTMTLSALTGSLRDGLVASNTGLVRYGAAIRWWALAFGDLKWLGLSQVG